MTTPLWRRYLRFWGADPAADVDDEFAFHLEMRIEELIAHGLSPKAARDEALRGFGNIQDVKRICRTLADERERAMQRTQWWSDWRHDFRFAVRQLTVSPILTAVLVVTIALGIGSTVAIFSVLNAVLLRPLPGADSDRIVWVYETLRSPVDVPEARRWATSTIGPSKAPCSSTRRRVHAALTTSRTASPSESAACKSHRGTSG